MAFKIPPAIKNLNFRIVPIRNGQKAPAVANWPDTTIRANSPEAARLESDPGFDAYGVVFDDDVVVVDVDVHNGGEGGYATLHDIMVETGVDLLSESNLVVNTPSGGCHLYFCYEGKEKLRKQLEQYPSVDLLSEGCQALGPGSRDGAYRLANNPTIPTADLFQLPDAFVSAWQPKKAAMAPATSSSQPDYRDGESPVDAFNFSDEGVQVLKSMLEERQYKLLWKGDGTFEFVRPGKREGNHLISGTLGRKSQSGRKILRNFSTSDPLFPADESVTIAEAYRLLVGCTFTELPPLLRAEGFGDQRAKVDVADIQRQLRSARTVGEELEQSYPTMTLAELVEREPVRHPYVIGGLLREGEVMNIVAAPKTGKSWFVYGLAATLATGGEFLGFDAPKNLSCLIVDNELHPSELAWRISKVTRGELLDDLQVCPLRGVGTDVLTLASKLEAAGAGRFDVIVLDALYRFLPSGTSENDNAAMAQVYNALDRIARQFNCAVICVHHTSKGDSSEKSVIDAGAGAGAISRAADTQLALFPHANGESIVIEAVTRSSRSPEARCARLVDCIWEHQPDLKPDRNVKKDAISAADVKKVQHGLNRCQYGRMIGNLLDAGANVIMPEHGAEIGLSPGQVERFLRDWMVPALVVQEVGKKKWRPTAQWREKLQEFLVNPFRVTEAEHVVEEFNRLKAGEG